jgi:signal transduction histidine kinase
LAALVLITLAWTAAYEAIHAHRTEELARVRMEALGTALAIEEQLRRELLTLDQTLNILEYVWERDPTHFDLATWSSHVGALSDVSLQLFISDAQGIVRSSTRPAIVGTDVSGRDYFRHEKALPADDDKMFAGSLTQGQVTHRWQINLVRRLDNSDGSFAGVIAASYDTNLFSRLYGEINSAGVLIAVVSMRDGNAWTLSNPAEASSVVNIANASIFAAMQASIEGSAEGSAGLDTADRIYSFATVPGRDLKVVVGVERAEAMGASVAWERSALIYAGGATSLMLLITALLLREENAARLRHESLARERAILEATLTGMSDGIIMVDGDMRLMAWNQHFPELTGVPPDILRAGVTMEEILRGQVASGEFGPLDLEVEVQRRLALLRAGATMGTIERARPSGQRLEIRRDPLPGGGFVARYSDVTARYQADERLRQAQTMAAVGRLTAGVAHDFNNLLMSISGNAEMARNQSGANPALAQRLAAILKVADRGAGLVRQLLAFSRKQALAPVRTDLNQLVRGIIDLLRATLGGGITVSTSLSSSLWPALIDPAQIEHVILNLSINARDAMPDGGTLTITTANATLGRSEELTPGDYVVIAVSDTGTGMTEEILRNAFEPFFTTKQPGQGSGLGLSQVHGMASQSGGGVQIDSTIGKGTTVRVLFPRAADEATTDARTAARINHAAKLGELRPEQVVNEQ